MADESVVGGGPVRSRWNKGGARIALYVVSIALWVLASALRPTALFAGLIWAAVVRGIYVAIRRRGKSDHPFWSPWLFVLAAVFTVFTLVGMQQAENDKTDRAAVERGVAKTGGDVSPVQRCITKVLEAYDVAPAEQRALVPGGKIRLFANRMCATAAREDVLAESGDLYRSDSFMRAACTELMMTEFDRVPPRERAFSRADFRLFGERYCAEVVSRDLFEGARTGKHRQELLSLQQQLLNEMVQSGEIEQLR